MSAMITACNMAIGASSLARPPGPPWWAAIDRQLDGVVPDFVVDVPGGRCARGGRISAITDLLTFSSASKRMIGSDGSIQVVAANQPAWDWSSGRRRLLIEAAPATNSWPYSEAGPAASLGGSGNFTLTATKNGLYGSLYRYAMTATAANQSIMLWPGNGALSVAAGGRVTFTIALLAGTRDRATVGIYGASTAWGGLGDTKKLVVAGPGVAAQADGTLWTVSGLSSTVPTLVSITRTTAVADTCWPLLYLDASGTSKVGDGIAFGRCQFEPGASATSYIPTTSTAAVTRIADDVRLSAAALASVTAPGGTTIVMRGSLVAATGWLAAWGQDAGVLLANAETGTWSLSNLSTGGPSSTGSLVAFGACAASGPGSAALSVGGAPVGTSSDVFGRTGDLRLGARPNGDFAASGLHLDELVVWPFAGSDAGIRSQARAWA